MKKSKLLDIFRVIGKEELRRLFEFTSSPYFNKKADVTKLCGYLIKVSRLGFPEKMLDQKLIYSAVYEGKNYDKKELAHTMSHLSKLCEWFLIQRNFEKDGIARDLYLMKVATEKKLNRTFTDAERKINLLEEKPPLQSTNYFWQNYLFHQIKEDQFAQLDTRKTDPFLQQTADSLDNFYFLQKLRLGCAMIARKVALSEEYDTRFLNKDILEKLREQAQLPSIIDLYILSFSFLQKDNDEAALLDFFEKLTNKLHEFSNEEKQELFNHAITYCIQQIRKGHRNFTNHLLDIYQKGLLKEILFIDGVLSAWNYKNIVKLSLGLKQFDWVGEFIEKYTKHLPVTAQSDAYHFSKADLHYHIQQYEEAMNHLNMVEYSDVHYAIGAKQMLIKIYYENKETEALFALLNSTKIFLMRSRLIGQETKQAYLNFIRFTNKLLKPLTLEKKSNLERDIIATALLNAKSWLVVQTGKKQTVD